MIDPRQVADALIAAERERKPIAPSTDMYPFLDAGRVLSATEVVFAATEVMTPASKTSGTDLTAPAARPQGLRGGSLGFNSARH
jgi:hypothetical protein